MDIDDDSVMRRRADRRVRTYLVVVGVLGVVAFGFIGVALSGAGPTPLLIVGGVLLLAAGLAVLLVQIIRRRSGSWASPLLGADRHTRRRVLRGIRTGTELPPGEQRLAIAEATRIRSVSWVVATPFVICALLNLFQFGVRLADGDAVWQIVSTGTAAAMFTFLTVHQFYYRHRSGVFLDRFGGAASGSGQPAE